MKRLRAWLRRLSIAALGLLAAWLLIQCVILPRFVQGRIIQALRDAGFADSRVTVRAVTPWRLEATGLKFDATGRHQLQTVTAEYSPSTLSAGRVNQLDLAGLRWAITLTPAGLDLGLPSALFGVRPSTAAPGLPLLPMQRVTLRDGVITLSVLGHEIPLPIDGLLEQPDPAHLHLDATVHLPAAPLHVNALLTGRAGQIELAGLITAPGVAMPFQGTIDPGTGAVHISGQSAPHFWLPTLACDFTQAANGDIHLLTTLSGQPSGPATSAALTETQKPLSGGGGLVVDYTRTAGQSRTRISYTQLPGVAAIPGILAADLDKAEFHAELDGRGQLTHVDGDLQADEVAVGSYTLSNLHLTVHEAADGLALDAAGQGPGWSLTKLHITSPQPALDLTGRSPINLNLAGSLAGRPPAWVQTLLGQAGVTLTKAGSVSLSVAGQASWAGQSAASPWHVQLTQADVALAPTTILLSQRGLIIQDIQMRLAGSADLRPGHYSFTLNPHAASSLAWNAISLTPNATQPAATSAPAPTIVHPGRLTLTQSGDALISWSTSRFHLGMELAADQPLDLTTPDFDVTTGQASVALRLDTGGGEPTRFISKLTLGQVSVRHKPTGLAVDDASIELPFTYGLKNPMGGSFRIGRVTYGKNPWPELTGSLDINEGVLKAAFATPNGAKLQINGSAELRLWDGPDGQIGISLLDYHVDDPQWLGRVAPQAQGVEVTGRFDLYGVINFVKGHIEPWITLVAHDAAVASQDLDAGATGIEAVVNFNRLDPPGTPPFQWMTIKAAHSGRLTLTNGQVNFTMQTPQSVLVERADWNLGKTGKFWVHGIWIDPTAKDMTLEVFLENVNIKDLLALAAQDSVEGDGVLLNGRVNVPLQPGQTPILLPLKDGWLQAHEGTSGWIEVRDKAALQRMLGAQGQDIAGEIQQRLADALSDFEVQKLSARFLTDDEGSYLQIEIAGRARRGEDPLVIKRLTVNIRGIENLLDEALRIQKMMTPRKR